jgi:hypothetical protein
MTVWWTVAKNNALFDEKISDQRAAMAKRRFLRAPTDPNG